MLFENSFLDPSDSHLRTLACARNYSDVVRRNSRQFGPKKIDACPSVPASNRLEVRPGTRSYGAKITRAHTAEFRPDNASLRAALSFERVHQYLSILRFLPGQSNSSSNARCR